MTLIDKIDEYFMNRIKKDDAYGSLYKLDDEMDYRSFSDEIKDFKKNSKYPFIIGVLALITLIHMLIGTIMYIVCLLNLSSKGIRYNIFYIIFWLLAPFGIWRESSAYGFWNYWNRKMSLLYIALANAGLLIMTQLLRGGVAGLLPIILKIPVTTRITPGMIVMVSRLILFLVSFIPAFFIFISVNNYILDDVNKKNIQSFKVLKGKDTRGDSEFKYDCKIITRLDTGKVYHIKEKDRMLHTLSDGVTGTGKSSSTLLPAIADDLDQKVHNEDYQKKECVKRLEAGDFVINTPFKDEDFSIRYISPVRTGNADKDKEIQEAYDFLCYKSQSAGITVMAPNETFADQCCELAQLRSIKVRRLDPVLTEKDEHKSGCVSLNPLYISPLVKGKKREVNIADKAIIVADIFKSLFELSGSTDAYFVSLNSTITTGICKLVMLTFPTKEHRTPTLADVQMLIHTPSKCKPYLEELVSLYGDKGMPYKGPKIELDQASKFDCGVWQDVFDMVNNDMLGSNAENIYDRANGLRNQFDTFLNHPLIRDVLCPVDDSLPVLDIDKALMDGEVVVVNFAQELGQSVSMGFGMFFMLLYSLAVRQRPGNEDTRRLNFFYADEISTIANKDIEAFVTYFRQYRVGSFLALQTLDQMDKTPLTRYLKGVLLGNCAHHIVFGRISPTEMKTYETMAGMMPDTIEQDTVSETSMSMEDPSYSYSRRTTLTDKPVVTGSDMRYRDFQEVTLFTVDDGNPIPPFAGKVNFVPSSKLKGLRRVRADWSRWILSDDFYEKRLNSEGILPSSTPTKLATVSHSKGGFKFGAAGIEGSPVILNEPVRPITNYPGGMPGYPNMPQGGPYSGHDPAAAGNDNPTEGEKPNPMGDVNPTTGGDDFIDDFLKGI